MMPSFLYPVSDHVKLLLAFWLATSWLATSLALLTFTTLSSAALQLAWTCFAAVFKKQGQQGQQEQGRQLQAMLPHKQRQPGSLFKAILEALAGDTGVYQISTGVSILQMEAHQNLPYHPAAGSLEKVWSEVQKATEWRQKTDPEPTSVESWNASEASSEADDRDGY